MPEPASPAGWTAGHVRKATPLPRRWEGAGAPPPGYAYDWRRAARVPVPAANDAGVRGMPLDAQEFYGLGETEPEEWPPIDLPWWAWTGIVLGLALIIGGVLLGAV